jgi:hypothetical protein
MGMKKEVADKLATLITAAFGFVAALAWNDAVKSLFANGGVLDVFGKYGIWFYAVLVTLIAVMITIWIGRVSSRVR